MVHPAVKTVSFIREGLNVQEGLYCYGLPAWGYLVVGCSGSMIWELSLAPKFILFLLTRMFPCFFRNKNKNFEQVASGKKNQRRKESNHLMAETLSEDKMTAQAKNYMPSIYACGHAS